MPLIFQICAFVHQRLMMLDPRSHWLSYRFSKITENVGMGKRTQVQPHTDLMVMIGLYPPWP